MPSPFDSFVVFAEMRTGSNFLEANLNAYPGLACHGELFNPHFIGAQNQAAYMGIGMEDRAADPLRLLARVREEPGLNGFRFFHDHDPRILEHILPDPRCAKIVLTRNPVDSYVSLQIARATGQWKLTNVTRQKSAMAVFDAEEFEAHLQAMQEFQIRLARGLQTTGQTAFYIAYEDIGDVEVINGLARFLGETTQLEALSRELKRQNPELALEKVINPAEMEASLARLDRFNLSRTPNFEPRRGPSVPNFRLGAKAPLIYMPVRCGPDQAVLGWLARLDGVTEAALRGGLTQKTLNAWFRQHPKRTAFTVIRHPLLRAYAAFADYLLSGRYGGVSDALRKGYGLSLPPPDRQREYGTSERRADFLRFLKFVKGNLAGQSAIRVDPAWASQGAVVRGFAEFLVPDRVIREDDLEAELTALAASHGLRPPGSAAAAEPHAKALSEIVNEELQAAARAAYARDFVEFGFGDWRPAMRAPSADTDRRAGGAAFTVDH